MGNTVAFEDRQGTELFKFTNPGDFVAGRLLAVEGKRVNVTEKKNGQDVKVPKNVTVFTVEERDGEDYTNQTGRVLQFIGTTDVLQKVRASDRGKLVIVAMTDETKDMGANKSPMRVFDCKVSRGPAPAPVYSDSVGVDDLQITDEDIGF